MSGLELNKIVASILLASLIAMLVGFLANILYKPKLKPEKRGYYVEVPHNKEDTNVTIEEAPVDIKQLMLTANSELGKQISKKCAICHTFNKGEPPRVGPNLWNIVNSVKANNDGSNASYKFSDALTKLGGNWDVESLFHFIHKPSKVAPGTKMSFIGLPNPQDIVNVIAYLQTLKD